MSDNEKFSQLDFINMMMDDITNLYKYCISLEERVGDIEVDARHDRETIDKLCHDIGSLKTYRTTNQENTAFFCDRLKEIHEKLDDMETDIDLLYAMTHSCDNFCGNCTHCKQYPDGLYKCGITACEIDPDTSSCIRFESPRPPKSDAEICKACSDKDTPRCYKCSHFPF